MLEKIRDKGKKRFFTGIFLIRIRYLLRILLFSLFRYSLLISRKRFVNVSIDNLVVSFYFETLNDLIRVKSLSGERKVISFLLNEIRSSDTVMDVGANIGTHSILFSKKSGFSGKVFSVEPNTLAVSKLKENIKWDLVLRTVRDLNGL